MRHQTYAVFSKHDNRAKAHPTDWACAVALAAAPEVILQKVNGMNGLILLPMVRFTRLSVCASIAILMSACALTPGTYIGDPDTTARRMEEQGAPPGALKTITPQLIQEEKQKQSVEVREDVQRLFATPQPYTIGPGDILNIMVWNHPELALTGASSGNVNDYASESEVGNGYNVSSDGTIQFPFLGSVKVAGMTEAQVRNTMTQSLSRYLNAPQLTVRIQAYRSGRVYADGAVSKPGLLALNDIPLTLPEAISRAGGFTPEADRSSIILSRNGVATRISLPQLSRLGLDPSRIMLQNGDVLRVSSREESKVYLLGDVFAPRAQPMNDGELSLAQALGEAGGVNPETGNPRQIYVIRKGDANHPEIYHLDAKSPTAFVLASQFVLQPHDMVFVDPAAVVRWNRVISMILPSYGAVYTTREMTR